MAGTTRSFTFRLTAEGVQEFEKQLVSAGEAGAAALEKLRQASPQLADQLDKARAAAEKFGKDTATAGDGAAKSFAAFQPVLAAGQAQIDSYAAQAGLLGKVLSTFGPVGLGVAAAIGAIGSAAFAGVEKLAAVQESTLKLNTVLTATGNNIGLTASQFNALTSDISKHSLTSVADLRAAGIAFASFGAAAFTSLEEVLKVSEGMSVLYGGDLKTNIIQLAKVFEDPANNLGKFGRMFDETTKAMIKDMAATGDQAGAIELIMTTLKSRGLGDVGEAESQGLTGAIARNNKAWVGLNVALADSLGLLDLVQKKAEGMAGAANAITNWLKLGKDPEVQANNLDQAVANLEKARASSTRSPTQALTDALGLTDPNAKNAAIDAEQARLRAEAARLRGVAAAERNFADEQGSDARLGQANNAKNQVDAKAAADAAAAAKLAADEAERQATAVNNAVVGVERQTLALGKTADEARRLSEQYALQDQLGRKLTDAEAQRLSLAQDLRKAKEDQLAADNADFAAAEKAADLRRDLDSYLSGLEKEAKLAGETRDARKEERDVDAARAKYGEEFTAQDEERLRAAEKLGAANAAAFKQAQDQATQLTRFWDRTANSAADSVSSAIVNGLASGQGSIKQFWASFEQIGLRAISDVLSAEVFRPLFMNALAGMGLGSGAAGGGTTLSGAGAGSGGGLPFGSILSLGKAGAGALGAGAAGSSFAIDDVSGLGSAGDAITVGGSSASGGGLSSLFSGASSLFGGGSGGGLSGLSGLFGGGGGTAVGMSSDAGLAMGGAGSSITELGASGAGSAAGSFIPFVGGALALYGASQAQSHLSGALQGAAGGAMIGTAIFPGIGTAIGAAAGALFGALMGGKPSVGPNGNANITIKNGQFALGSVGADNGLNPAGIIGGAQDVIGQLNQILGAPGTTLDASRFDPTRNVYSVSSMKGQTSGDLKSILGQLINDGFLQVDPAIITGALNGTLSDAIAQLKDSEAIKQDKLAIQQSLSDLATSFAGLLQPAQQLADGLTAIGAQVKGTVDSLQIDPSLSPLTPAERLAQARGQFAGAVSAAQGGDLSAYGTAQSLARNVLAFSRAYSPAGYGSDFAATTATLSALGAGATAQGAALAADVQRLTAIQAEIAAGNVGTHDRLDALTAEVVGLREDLRIQGGARK